MHATIQYAYFTIIGCRTAKKANVCHKACNGTPTCLLSDLQHVMPVLNGARQEIK